MVSQSLSRLIAEGSQGNAYLIVYNTVLCLGWGYCFYLAAKNLAMENTVEEFWKEVELPLKIFQTAACLEILHSAIGLVRSPVLVTTMQVFSRIWIVWGIINPVQHITTKQSFEMFKIGDFVFKLDLVSLVIAWGLAEIIRYGFFALKGLNLDSSIFQWLRYTGFIALYPLGVSCELTMVFFALPFIKASKLWTLSLPNNINYGFDYFIFCMLVALSYIPFFPQLYFYMWAQRKKAIIGQKYRWLSILWNKSVQVAVTVTICAGIGCYTLYYLREKHRNEKPQRRFRTVLCDNTDRPFLHRQIDGKLQETTFHPYQQTILSLQEYPLPIGVNLPGIPDTPVSWIWVDSTQSLSRVVSQLKELDRFALDVEYHRYRSYHGFICLMQIFTGKCIYLIDVIKLHDQMEVLNEVLSDPNIRKVLHGCHNDIIWLQKDFRIYLVNVFDTEKACQVLRKGKSNLAHLLEEYFHIKSDKTLQQADWRTRPLPQEQLQYARMDVHFLLALEDILKMELITEDRLSNLQASSGSYARAVQKSHDLSLNLFKKTSSVESATTCAVQLVRKHYDLIGKKEDHEFEDISEDRLFLNAVFSLCFWRDQTARLEDESVEYILTSKILIVLAQDKPITEKQITRVVSQTPCFDFTSTFTEPSYWKPPCVFLKRIHDLVQILLDVVEEKLVWKEGPALLNPKTRHKKWKSKEEADKVRQKTVLTYSAKNKVYENCTMLSVDGELLCYCDRRRLDWYVRKKIAKVECQDPYTIRLLFQHQLTDTLNGSHDFYAQSRLNRCVNCGEEEHYLRYKVVPACYRRNFPVELKSHRSHDIVLLCIDCHQQAQTVADRLKKELAEEYDVPLICSKQDQSELKVSASKLRAAALALRDNRDQIPPERIRELEARVHSFFGRDPENHDSVDSEDLELGTIVGLGKRELRKWIRKHKQDGENEERISDLLSKAKQALDESGEQTHGEQVVQKALQHGGIPELNNIIRRFREAFVTSLQPRFLPEKWNVDHFAPRQFGEHSVFYHEPDASQDLSCI